MRRFVAASAVVLCIGVVSGAPFVSADAPLHLEVASERIAISSPGHRFSEYALAQDPVDPTHLIVGGMDWDNAAGGVACATMVSRDGGLSWHPGGSIPGLDGAHARYDPWVAIDPDHRAHLVCQDQVGEGLIAPPLPDWDSPIEHFKYARSDDGGDTWSPAVRPPLRAPTHTTDKESIHAARDGRVYACAASHGDLLLWRSDDGGDTWNAPVALDADAVFGNRSANCNGIIEGPQGQIYVNFLSLGDPFNVSEPSATIWGTIASFDHGETWQPATKVAIRQIGDLVDLVSTAGGQYPAWTWPSLAVSPKTGHLFGAMMQFDPTLKIYYVQLYRSIDQGVSYQQIAYPIPTSTLCVRCHITRPSVGFDANGNVAVTLSLATDLGAQREQDVLVSVDEGNSWLPPLVIGTSGPADNLDQRHRAPQDPATTVPADANQLLDPQEMDAGVTVQENRTDDHHLTYGGDYSWGLVAVPDGFFVTWNDRAEGGISRIWGRIVRIAS